MGLTSDALKRIENQAAAAVPVILPLSDAAAWTTMGDVSADFQTAASERLPGPGRFSFPALATKRPTTTVAPPQVIWPSDIDAEQSLQAAEMASRILRQWPPDRATILAVTSAGPGDGKTRLLTALAPQLARRVAGGVLVVDANVCHPSLTALATILPDAAKQPGVVYPTDRRRLSFLPAPDGRRDVCESLDRFGGESLRDGWSLVLIELPSLADAEAIELSRHCDGVYLAVRLGHTSRRALNRAVKTLRGAGGRLAGCLVAG